ncbi:hypothetical protein [Rhodoblastus sp.]|uniref:hypothetical protein n=1 Tax=Rhodoblastus sp. TaxID=1962975 RepID=UPI003F978858
MIECAFIFPAHPLPPDRRPLKILPHAMIDVTLWAVSTQDYGSVMIRSMEPEAVSPNFRRRNIDSRTYVTLLQQIAGICGVYLIWINSDRAESYIFNKTLLAQNRALDASLAAWESKKASPTTADRDARFAWGAEFLPFQASGRRASGARLGGRARFGSRSRARRQGDIIP